MPEPAKDWKGVTGGSTLGQKALLWLFHFNNITVGYVILALVVPFYMLFARKGYLAIYRYFRQRHGYSPLKSFLKTYVNHFVFGQCMLDRFAVYAGRRNLFRFRVEDEELFSQLLEGDKGFVVASSHVGNFELCGYMLSQDRKRINAVVFGGETQQVMENRRRVFERNNVTMIPVMHDMSHIFAISNAMSEGQIVSMPADRSFGSAKVVECDLLGARADFPVGAFSLAVQYEVPVLAVFVMKTGMSDYTVYVKRIDADASAGKKEKIEKLTRAFASQLEVILHRYPEQWFNFYNFWK